MKDITVKINKILRSAGDSPLAVIYIGTSDTTPGIIPHPGRLQGSGKGVEGEEYPDDLGNLSCLLNKRREKAENTGGEQLVR